MFSVLRTKILCYCMVVPSMFIRTNKSRKNEEPAGTHATFLNDELLVCYNWIKSIVRKFIRQHNAIK